MTMKTTKRTEAVIKRCSECECGKLEDIKESVYGLKHYHYRCYAKSKRGRDCRDLRYSCPLGKQLVIE